MWRQDDQWTLDQELAVLAIEQRDRWNRALFDAATGKRQIEVPAPLEINRPGTTPEREESNHVVTDPREIAAFFN